MINKQLVLFVCEHGSAKSVVAAAHFNKLALAKNLVLRAISRGTDPDEEIPRFIVEGLEGEGLTPGELKPKLLSKGDIAGALRVAAFCDLPDRYGTLAPIEIPASPSNTHPASSKARYASAPISFRSPLSSKGADQSVKPVEKNATACIAHTHPNDGWPASIQSPPHHKVRVLADQYGARLGSSHPDPAIGRSDHAEVSHMLRLMPQLHQTAGEPRRKLRIDDEAHDYPILMIG